MKNGSQQQQQQQAACRARRETFYFKICKEALWHDVVLKQSKCAIGVTSKRARIPGGQPDHDASEKQTGGTRAQQRRSSDVARNFLQTN
jgi:hypothetical protein